MSNRVKDRAKIALLRGFDEPPMNGAQLKRWRERRGLTQHQLAQFLQQAGYTTHPRTIRKWENGERGVPHWVPFLVEAIDESFPPS